MNELRINDDFDAPAFVDTARQTWVASPQGGVERIMLDRIGGEVARATSIVRYAAGSSFAEHRHHGGEEILVLSGVFSDEQGDYPAGWYLRNPPGSSHRPHSKPGAIIFVKLSQMGDGERQAVRVDTTLDAAWSHAQGRRVCLLYRDDVEDVFLQDLRDGEALAVPLEGGVEILVVSGALATQGREMPTGSWLRWPHRRRLGPAVAIGPTRVWVKLGVQRTAAHTFVA